MKCIRLILFALAFHVCGYVFAQDDDQQSSKSQELDLYYSPTTVRKLLLNGYQITVLTPTDERAKHLGESFYGSRKIENYNDFWKKSIEDEIKGKIERDLDSIKPKEEIIEGKKIDISSRIEVFYPDVRGFIWGKSYAKVRIHFTVKSNVKTLIDKSFEEFYMSDGKDPEYQGTKDETIEESANITIGIALRKLLDKFYGELNLVY